MGVVEALVHTADLAVGLDVAWHPPVELSARVLDHLFPRDTIVDDLDGDAADALLVATGRLPDADGVFRTSWRWYNRGR